MTWLLLIPCLIAAAAVVGAWFHGYRAGHVDGTDDTWAVVHALVPDLPASLEELLAQAEAHGGGCCDLIDDGCPVADPDCEGTAEQCHDACEPPACRVCGCTEYAACPGGCSWVIDPAGVGPLCSAPACRASVTAELALAEATR